MYCTALIKAKIKIQTGASAQPASPSHTDCAGVKPSEIPFGFPCLPARSPSSCTLGHLPLSGSGIFPSAASPDCYLRCQVLCISSANEAFSSALLKNFVFCYFGRLRSLPALPLHPGLPPLLPKSTFLEPLFLQFTSIILWGQYRAIPVRAT